MKFLIFLLSIYLASLSCMPCADIEVNSTAHSKEVASHKKEPSQDHEKDSCSPFCICNCCGAQILNYSPVINFEFPAVVAVIETKESIYKPSFISNFYGSIWQPPQIV